MIFTVQSSESLKYKHRREFLQTGLVKIFLTSSIDFS